MDNMTSGQRSLTMSNIKSKETSPERKLRLSLFRIGYRYRKNVRLLPGKPDIVLRKYGSIIFVNGCFWHHHNGCGKATIPQTNVAYWQEKLRRNISKDTTNLKMLEEMGWKVMTVYECEINNDLASTLTKVVEFLNSSSTRNSTVNGT